jgi:hypothetical protein
MVEKTTQRDLLGETYIFACSITDVIGFFNLPNPSSPTMGLGSTQPLAEMSTRNHSGGKGRPARKADTLTVVCEPTV